MSAEASRAGTGVAPFVEGASLPVHSDEHAIVINPSTGRQCLTIPAGSQIDTDRAVASARRAFDDARWSGAPPATKKKVLHRLADLIAADAAHLDVLDAEEMGKPVSEPRANASSAANLLRFYAEAVDKVTGDTLASDASSFVAELRMPRGVVAAITPWNFPTSNAVRKLAPALAAGNCIVLKPSEVSSRSALHLAHLALQAGLPPGAFNVVPGLGRTVGSALALHSDVDMLAFTGSTDVGKLMMQYAGQSNMKVVMAECGGKSPQLVFADGVDLDVAADHIAASVLTNQGQICSAGSRLLVERSIADSLVETVAARCKKIVMGDALSAKTTFGPIVSAKQCARVMRYIETAHEQGARLVTGGQRALLETGGFFIEPTVFRDVSATSAIAQEEIFGPVLAVMTFDDEAEAIRIANGTRYGLAAYVWTADLSRGMRVAKAMRAPVWINAGVPSTVGAGYATPFEPTGLSGIGVEGGVAGMESYLRRQLVAISHA